MKRLLIANRGEIAVRIIRACREYGISPVAVYSDADKDLPFVALADAALNIGPGPAAESYLHQGKILDAARTLGADALHPGYGFLSENADFAAACADAGITYVGPPASVIRALGDKIAAKALVAGVGVPTVPGYSGAEQDDELLRREAERIGPPLIIKASAGGGGRGMRLVRDLADFLSALAEARREAVGAFGDDRVLLERYVERPHHIEFQIFGDRFGNVVHLGERECSVQRRHQKIIEESPSPALSPELREQMGQAAVAAARAANYENAGTVEFLLETGPDGVATFYFLEVNTRLQVEHPVTEAVTGQDLVRWQLLIADGHPLPLSAVPVTGASIEARIYAEDPATGFLPSVGEISRWTPPAGAGVRVDAGYEAGSVVPPFYDPMVAKVITSGANRAEAIARMERALREFAVSGVHTNIPYLQAIVGDSVFQAGDTTTRFLEERLPDWKPDDTIPEEVLLALAAESLLPGAGSQKTGDTARGQRRATLPWEATDGWRNVK